MLMARMWEWLWTERGHNKHVCEAPPRFGGVKGGGKKEGGRSAISQNYHILAQNFEESEDSKFKHFSLITRSYLSVL